MSGKLKIKPQKCQIILVNIQNPSKMKLIVFSIIHIYSLNLFKDIINKTLMATYYHLIISKRNSKHKNSMIAN